MTDDKALVAQILDGNMQAYRLLIKLNERLVFHMIAKLISNREEQEEICQDVFLKVYQKLSEFNFQSKLSTWIATIAYRHAINALRKNKVELQELPAGETDHAVFVSEENPEAIAADKDMEEYLLKLISQLPPQYRMVLSLYHVEGMNYEEIGAVTSMPAGTVKNYLFRARHMLKEKVKSQIKA